MAWAPLPGSAFRKGLYTAVALLIVLVALTARPQYVESAIGAFLITCAALLPSALWIRSGAKGLPLFPLLTVTYVWTFALPLVEKHPLVSQFPAESQLIASLSVSGFLLLATLIWSFLHQRRLPTRHHYFVLPQQTTDVVFLFSLGLSIIFEVAVLTNWFAFPAGIYSIARAIVIALEALSCFILSYRLGATQLSLVKAVAFAVLVFGLMIASLPSLLLVSAMSTVGISFVGYTLGARRLPWVMAGCTFLIFAFLHAGKAEMRTRYWQDGNEVMSLTSYPAFLANWFSTSATAIASQQESEQSILERASLMHLLLSVQSSTPSEIPYFEGETYKIIPELLIPRIFSPDKARSHEGTYMLDVAYGLETEEGTRRTTIGFGMLNEAYANFGYFGVALLALVSGIFYAAVERCARGAPVLSLRSLFAILVASYAFQTEFTAGVYVAGLFQSSIALAAFAVLFMRRIRAQANISI